MKTSTLAIVAVIAIIVAGGAWYAYAHGYTPGSLHAATTTPEALDSSNGTPSGETTGTAPVTSNGAQTVSGSVSVTATPVPAPSATPAAQHFTVNGNDSNADVTSISVPKGTPVTITFGADLGTTYHGGLDFRSSVVNTGTIVPGSTKSISFTANQSFSFTPYWPATNIAKPYKITVTVTS